jgi:PKD repeat protein
VRLHRPFPIVLGGAVLAAAAANATSIVPPANLGELARMSDAVVLAVAGTSQTVPRGSLLFTTTSFRVLRSVAGPLQLRDRITVEVPGGELDGIGWLVAGSPHFEAGGVYLLFLDEKPSGDWLPKTMAYGLLRQIPGRDGSLLLQPLVSSEGIELFPLHETSPAEPIGTYVQSALLPHLRAVISGGAWDSQKVLAKAEQAPIGVTAQTIPSGCAFESYNGINFRWHVFDSGGSVSIAADQTGDSSLAGGGFSEVQGAIGMWDGVPSTSINLTYGGAQSYAMACTGGQDTPAKGVNIVMFNDPCSDIPDLSGCSGTLGFGGPWFSFSTNSLPDGTTWYTIISQFVVVNNGSGCIGSLNYQHMMAHELGHGLGFDHVSDHNALMYPSCDGGICNSINSTDTTCAQYVYPSGGPPGPTPTPTTATPPPAPTGVSASDGTYSDRILITWNASAGATSYDVYRNTVNNSGTATYLGNVTTTGAWDSDPSLVPGTPYWYWIKAKNAAGVSNFSTSNSGYVATTPVPTPTPTGPVPTPTPSGPAAPTGVSASDGTFTDRVRITWNASPGATGYWIYRNTTASPPAAEIGGAFSPGYDDLTAVAGQTYWYWVRAGNASGWSTYSVPDTGFRATTPFPTPTPSGGLTAAFTFLPNAPIAGRQVQFTDTSTGATSWQWTFGDGQGSTAQNPSHTYATPGAYTVTLRVSNAVGSSQTSKSITVGARARRHLSRH